MKKARINDLKDLRQLVSANFSSPMISGAGAHSPVMSSAAPSLDGPSQENVICEEENFYSDLPEVTNEELGALLKGHQLWLGFSEKKGWLLLDRSKSEFQPSTRFFITLSDECSTTLSLSSRDFGKEPDGPLALHYWKNIPPSVQSESGSIRRIFPDIKEYVERIEQEAYITERMRQIRIQDELTQIRPLPESEYPEISDPEYWKKLQLAKLNNYGKQLPARIGWLTEQAEKLKTESGELAARNPFGNYNIN